MGEPGQEGPVVDSTVLLEVPAILEVSVSGGQEVPVRVQGTPEETQDEVPRELVVEAVEQSAPVAAKVSVSGEQEVPVLVDGLQTLAISEETLNTPEETEEPEVQGEVPTAHSEEQSASVPASTDPMGFKREIPDAWRGRESQVWTGPISGYKERTLRGGDVKSRLPPVQGPYGDPVGQVAHWPRRHNIFRVCLLAAGESSHPKRLQNPRCGHATTESRLSGDELAEVQCLFPASHHQPGIILYWRVILGVLRYLSPAHRACVALDEYQGVNGPAYDILCQTNSRFCQVAEPVVAQSTTSVSVPETTVQASSSSVDVPPVTDSAVGTPGGGGKEGHSTSGGASGSDNQPK
ncbi:unnamed protein product [Mytilus edulis]|uniref:Uncharacterized protein n=1 Tax=Mytilus edulis TaxID=6550 RepID=A0A8S3TM11_MYTED|nr:unnamed protein product [Mytilus edulis]